MIRIHNSETDELIDREMNDAEFEQYKAIEEAESIKQAEIVAKETSKTALLKRLGITAEEAALLLS